MKNPNFPHLNRC